MTIRDTHWMVTVGGLIFVELHWSNWCNSNWCSLLQNGFAWFTRIDLIDSIVFGSMVFWLWRRFDDCRSPFNDTRIIWSAYFQKKRGNVNFYSTKNPRYQVLGNVGTECVCVRLQNRKVRVQDSARRHSNRISRSNLFVEWNTLQFERERSWREKNRTNLIFWCRSNMNGPTILVFEWKNISFKIEQILLLLSTLLALIMPLYVYFSVTDQIPSNRSNPLLQYSATPKAIWCYTHAHLCGGLLLIKIIILDKQNISYSAI